MEAADRSIFPLFFRILTLDRDGPTQEMLNSILGGDHQWLQPTTRSDMKRRLSNRAAALKPSCVRTTRSEVNEDFSSLSRLLSGHYPIVSTDYGRGNIPKRIDRQDHHHTHDVQLTSPLPSLSIKHPESMRPFPGDVPMDSRPPVKYTPFTGRVSKALKGVPLHTCYDCVPPRVRVLSYLRASLI